MSSGDHLLNNRPFDLYTKQEGYSQSNGYIKSALHVNCEHPSSLTNMNRCVHLTAEQSQADYELPPEIRGKECIFFRDIKHSDKFTYNILYEVEPIFGRRWIAQCVNEKYKWIDLSLDSTSEVLGQYAWINSSRNISHKDVWHTDIGYYTDNSFYATISANIDLINNNAQLHIQGSFKHNNSTNRTNNNFSILSLDKLCNALNIHNIHIKSENTSVILLGQGAHSVYEYGGDFSEFGYTGLMCYDDPTNRSINFNRIYSRDGSSGSLPFSNRVFDEYGILYIDIHYADIEKHTILTNKNS